MKIRKKLYTEENVLEAARNRIRHLYNSFDSVCVSFSGGKDSTACLNLCVEIARERGRLPVRAIFFDEEAIHPPTVEYLNRINERKDVSLEWFCLPVQHRNACSNDEPFWTCWEQSKRHLWVRPMPSNAISSHPMFKIGMSFQEFCPLIVGRNGCIIQGIRTEESLRRYQMVANKKNDNFITRQKTTASGFPIYDWSSQDVWRYVTESGCDYNRFYDILNRTRKYNNFLSQRVCPPFGEEPLRGLWLYAECFPDMWEAMLKRVTGAATAWRYANTELYKTGSKPTNLSWQEYINILLSNYTESSTREEVSLNLDAMKREHFNKTSEPIPNETPHPVTGCSWKFLSASVQRGDFKGRQKQQMHAKGATTRTKLGITNDQAKKLYGK